MTISKFSISKMELLIQKLQFSKPTRAHFARWPLVDADRDNISKRHPSDQVVAFVGGRGTWCLVWGHTPNRHFFTGARAHIEQGTCEKVRIDVSKVCAHRAHITCMPRAYRVHAACRPRAYHMHIPCIPCAYHMCTKCIPHAYHVDTTWIPRVYQNIPRAYCVHTTSTPRACHVRAACIPNAYHVHTTRIHLTCTVCTRYTPTAYHMHTTCTPSRSTSEIDHLAGGYRVGFEN